MLEMTFFNDTLLFKGDINQIRDYTIQSKNFEIYGNYMCNGDLYKQQFKINLAMKHILALNKIC